MHLHSFVVKQNERQCYSITKLKAKCGKMLMNVDKYVASLTSIASFNMVIVVQSTIIEKINVQIGSASCHVGSNQMIMAAQKTPILCRTSPNTCMNAARTFMFSVWPWPASALPPPCECPWVPCSCQPMLKSSCENEKGNTRKHHHPKFISVIKQCQSDRNFSTRWRNAHSCCMYTNEKRATWKTTTSYNID